MFTIDARRIYQPSIYSQKPRLSIDDGVFHQLGQQPTVNPHLKAWNYDLVPGFIDLQINGAFGFDFTSDPESIWNAGRRLPELGISTCLPTIITTSLKNIETALSVWRKGSPQEYQGTQIPGFHLEGPFLNPQKIGAHSASFIQVADPRLVEDWSPENGVQLVTIAPEMPGAVNLILNLHQRGIVMSAGHSLADIHQARAGFAAGIQFATHLFNVMTPVNHHDPGLAIAVLDNENVAFSLIVDGLHVAAEMVRLAWNYNGKERLVLVTDAMAALGMHPGAYPLGDQEIIVDSHSARLPDGTLAGSILTPVKAIQNLISFTNCSFQEALACWTTNPARLMGFKNRGVIKPGCAADFVLLNSDQQIAATFIAGELVYQAPWAQLNWD